MYYTHKHTFNSPSSGTSWVSKYQKGKVSVDSTEAGDREWLWHQLGHMQVCTSVQTDNRAYMYQYQFAFSVLEAVGWAAGRASGL